MKLGKKINLSFYKSISSLSFLWKNVKYLIFKNVIYQQIAKIDPHKSTGK